MVLKVRHYTDPGCPFAFSAEPVRRRLSWLYGDQLAWELRMVGLSERPEDYLEKGFTPERQTQSLKRIQRRHGMPIDPRERPRMAATLPACRAVVAARVHAPEREEALLRRLRVLTMAGELLDEPDTLARAAHEAGLVWDELSRWMQEPAVADRVAADMEAARAPTHRARALDYRLAADGDDGRRYTCPSYEIVRDDGVELAIPGFQPFEAYEVVLANLAPDLERREDPESVGEVLAWADEPLASAEVAAVCGVARDEARERLARVACETPAGADGYWELSG